MAHSHCFHPLLHYSAMDRARSINLATSMVWWISTQVQRFRFQKGRGLGSRDRDPISKFWEPLITFEQIEQSASNLVQRWRTEPSCVWNIKQPIAGLARVTWPNFEILGPLITFERKELAAWNSVPTQRTYKSKTTPRWARGVAEFTWPNFQIRGPLLNELCHLLQIWYIDGGRIPPGCQTRCFSSRFCWR